MKKKLVITLSVIGFIIGLILTLMWTVFGFSKVEFDFRASIENQQEIETEILDKVNFNYGETVFFSSKKRYKNEIEKNFPTLKVINIETKFPNTYVIHLALRTPIYSLQVGDKFYSLDEDYKVLDCAGVLNEELISIYNIVYENDEISVCDFLALDESISKSYFELYAIGMTKSMQISTYESISISNDNLTLKMRSGQTIVIENTKKYLRQKLQRALDVQSDMFKNLVENGSGERGKFYPVGVDENGDVITEFFSVNELQNAKITVSDGFTSDRKIYATIQKTVP